MVLTLSNRRFHLQFLVDEELNEDIVLSASQLTRSCDHQLQKVAHLLRRGARASFLSQILRVIFKIPVQEDDGVFYKHITMLWNKIRQKVRLEYGQLKDINDLMI